MPHVNAFTPYVLHAAQQDQPELSCYIRSEPMMGGDKKDDDKQGSHDLGDGMNRDNTVSNTVPRETKPKDKGDKGNDDGDDD